MSERELKLQLIEARADLALATAATWIVLEESVESMKWKLRLHKFLHAFWQGMINMGSALAGDPANTFANRP